MTRRFDIASLAIAAVTLGTPVASLESTALNPGERSDLSVALSLEKRAHEMAEHPREAHELRERGRLLTRSPLLDTGDRVVLLQRLDDRSEVR